MIGPNFIEFIEDSVFGIEPKQQDTRKHFTQVPTFFQKETVTLFVSVIRDVIVNSDTCVLEL